MNEERLKEIEGEANFCPADFCNSCDGCPTEFDDRCDDQEEWFEKRIFEFGKAARNYVPELIEEVRRLRAELERQDKVLLEREKTIVKWAKEAT